MTKESGRAGTAMLRIVECPACGGEVNLRGVLTPHIGGTSWVCEASDLSYEDALAIQIIRVEGGERLRLAAHP